MKLKALQLGTFSHMENPTKYLTSKNLQKLAQGNIDI